MLKRLTLIGLMGISAFAVASTVTPNMSLVIPGVGDTNYPTSFSTSMNLLDGHDHTPGKGTPIPALGLASSAVTTAKILDANVTGAKLADSAVTQAKVADGAITQAKMAARSTGSTVGAGGLAISASSGGFDHVITSEADVTNLTVTITTTGRPVFVGLIPDGQTGGGAEAYLQLQPAGSATSTSGILNIYRDATKVSRHVPLKTTGSAASQVNAPVSSVWHIDTPAAGTYTYKVSANMTTTASTTHFVVAFAKLIAYEL